MTPAELKAQAHKTVRLPTYDTEIQIRVVTIYEVSRANLNGILASNNIDRPVQEERELSLKDVARADLMRLEGLMRIIEKGAVNPRVVFAEERGEPVPDGAIDGGWISADLDWLATEIINHSKLSAADEAELQEFRKNALSPGSPTPSHEDTGDSLMKSSA